MAQRLASNPVVDVDPTSDLPIYSQISLRLKDLISSGELKPGIRLPPIRRLAKQLNVNPMTVAKAYRELAENGLAEARKGGGTFVLDNKQPPHEHMPVRAPDEQDAEESLTARLFELARAPGVIGFTANYPGPEESGAASFRQHIASLAADPAADRFFRYDPPNGRQWLREEISRFLSAHQLSIRPGDILVTSGGQQAIDLIARTCLQPGDEIVIERPAYFGAINAFKQAGARLLEVPVQSDGPDLDVLEKLLRGRPRLVYLNPTFQNPTGITTSLAKRQAIVALLRQYEVPLLEDDHNSDLWFHGTPIPSLHSMRQDGDHFYYVRSFGKSFVPGVRLGFLLAPDRALRALARVKTLTDMQSNAFMQGAMASWLAAGEWRTCTARLISIYKERQERLISALRRDLPSGVRLTQPAGGLSLWLTLPPGTDVGRLYYRAVQHGVAFAPGHVFFATNPEHRSMRLSFGLVPPDLIEEGARRLQHVMRDLIEQRRLWSDWAV